VKQRERQITGKLGRIKTERRIKKAFSFAILVVIQKKT
jgi:hypothetical protein